MLINIKDIIQSVLFALFFLMYEIFACKYIYKIKIPAKKDLVLRYILILVVYFVLNQIFGYVMKMMF